MKTLTQIKADSIYHEVIIESFPSPDMDDKKHIAWVDQSSCIAKCHQNVKTVTVYLKDSNDYSKITAIVFDARSIMHLYKKFTEIELQESEEFID